MGKPVQDPKQKFLQGIEDTLKAHPEWYEATRGKMREIIKPITIALLKKDQARTSEVMRKAGDLIQHPVKVVVTLPSPPKKKTLLELYHEKNG
jgi:hypothetical protein